MFIESTLNDGRIIKIETCQIEAIYPQLAPHQTNTIIQTAHNKYGVAETMQSVEEKIAAAKACPSTPTVVINNGPCS